MAARFVLQRRSFAAFISGTYDKMKSWWNVGCALLLGLFVAGCNNGATVVASAADLATPATLTPVLRGGDKIKVTVFGEDKLSGEYEIDPGGFVSLPLAGTIPAAGLTKSQLESELAKKFKGDYLKNPKVTVDVSSFRPFYVLGEVQKPGEYPYKSGLNVLSAIAVAGGQTYRASNDSVLIQRDGESELKKFPLNTGVAVYPGDLIRLPERYF